MSAKEIGLTLLTAATGANSREASLGGFVATVGTSLTAALGGWDMALKLLIFLMLADYATGILGAIRTGTLNSEVMFWGGVRKGVVLGVIMLAVVADQFIGSDAPVFRTLAIYFYAGREGLSVVENLGPLGVPLPEGFVKFLEQLQDKGSGKGGAA